MFLKLHKYILVAVVVVVVLVYMFYICHFMFFSHLSILWDQSFVRHLNEFLIVYNTINFEKRTKATKKKLEIKHKNRCLCAKGS